MIKFTYKLNIVVVLHMIGYALGVFSGAVLIKGCYISGVLSYLIGAVLVMTEEGEP